MRQFQYKAIDKQGDTVRSACHAETRSDALLRLKSEELCVLELTEASDTRTSLPRVSQQVISRFYAMLADQLQVEVPLHGALELIASQERKPEAKQFIGSIAHSVATGDSLSQALAQHPSVFSRVELNLIRAGEEGGFLPDSIERITEMREWQAQMKSKIWGAAAYPVLLITIAAVLIPAILVYLVPNLEPVLDSLRQEARLPWATQALLAVSALCRNYGGSLLLACLLTTLALVYLVPTARLHAVRDRNILRVPFFGSLLREFFLSRFCRVLGTLLSNKVQVLTSLEIATQVLGNQHIASSISPAREAVSTGRLVTDSLRKTNQFPAEVLAMLGVAEQSNRLDSVLLKVAHQLELRTNRRLETTVKLIEPILLLVMAALVGFVVLALLLPIFEGQVMS